MQQQKTANDVFNTIEIAGIPVSNLASCVYGP